MRGVPRTNSTRDIQRKSQLKRNIHSLTHTHQLILLQETHLTSYSKHHLKSILPKSWKATHTFAPEGDKWSGTAIGFSPHIDRHFHLHTHRSPHLNGRAQIIDLLPREEIESTTLSPLRIVNVYLPSGSQGITHAKRLIQNLTAKLNTLPPLPLLLGGDFNNITDRTDTSAPKTRLLRQSSPDWQQATSKLHLTELYQQTHTCFNSQQTSSRVDRIYTSLTQNELHWANPAAFIPPIPHHPLQKGPTPPPSDHFPVGVTFLPKRNRGQSTKIPNWIPDHPLFQEKFREEWNSEDQQKDPFTLLNRFKEVAKHASKQTLQSLRATRTEFSSDIQVYTDILRATKYYTTTKPLTRRPPPPNLSHLFPNSHPTLRDLEKELLTTVARLSKPSNPPPPAPTTINQHHHAPTSAPHTPTLDTLTALIPTARLRLPGLKSHPNDTLSTNPATMTRLASKYWKTIWKRQDPNPDTIQDYLESHSNRVQGDFSPPSRDNIQEEITKPRNSSPGPDGIPFAVYRVLPELASPILHAVATQLQTKDAEPPPGFNAALLFLLPKGTKYTPDDTRPISITNTDNRLIAAAIARKLGPVLNNTLHPAQQGFIIHRNYDSHIHTLTHQFYCAEHNNTQQHILFLDTAKAFDTIHHKYIHKILKTMHFPAWFRNTITHLTQNITAKLSFANRHAPLIPIQRGVKQGCPLSPLLFAICFDPLLHHLSNIRGLQAFAVADDLAIATRSLQRLPHAMRRIDDFKRASGLGHNIHKTALLSSSFSKPPHIRRWLSRSPWPGMTTTRNYKYLGIQIGNDVTVEGIYSKAVNKATKRLIQLRPMLRRAQTHQRLFIVNTYVIPILAYIARFYIPDPNQPEIKSLMRTISQHTIRFQGKAYKHLHIHSTADRAGPTPGITHPTHLAIAQLATGRPATARAGTPSSQLKSDPRRSTVRQTEEALKQIMEKMESPTVPDPTSAPAATRRQYRKLLQASFHKQQNTDLQLLLQRRELTHTPTAQAHLHRLFHLTRNPIHRNHQFDILTNAVATSRRFRHVLGRERSEVPKCYLCNEQEDSADHLYGHCPVVTEGKRLFWKEQGLPTPDLSRDHYVNPTLPADKTAATRLAQATTTFNYAVWIVRCRHEREPNPTRISPRELCQEAIYSWKLNHKQGQAFGSATNRTEEQRNKALEYAHRLMKLVNNTGITAFTDGAAKGNPGPCGAGCHIQWNTEESSSYMIALGTNSNNFGEWWGAGMALQATLIRLQHNQLPPHVNTLHVFTDSNLLCHFISKNFLPQKASKIQQQIYTLFNTLREHIQVYFHWIPGHSGVQGNETADQLANQGATESLLYPPPTSIIQHALAHSNFLPDLIHN